MNKFDLLNKVYTSDLSSTQKNLLCYLITKSNDKWESWPTVARLAQVAGVKYEKNFVLSKYLGEEFVTVKRVGKRNHYYLNPPAVAGLKEGVVVFNETPSRNNPPAVEGVNPPAPAENTPAVEGLNPPAVEGTESTEETTRETTEETTPAGVADAPPLPSKDKQADASSISEEFHGSTGSPILESDSADLSALSKYKHPPAPAGVSELSYRERAVAGGFGFSYDSYMKIPGWTEKRAYQDAKKQYERNMS